MLRATLVVLLLAPSAFAMTLEDARGDHYLAPIQQINDLVALHVDWVDDELQVVVDVAEIGQTVGVEPLEATFYDVQFNYGTQRYSLGVSFHPYLVQATEAGPSSYASLHMFREGSGWISVADDLAVAMDTALATFTASLDPATIKDDMGVMLQAGASLTEWSVLSSNTGHGVAEFVGVPSPFPSDRLPDEGRAEEIFTVEGGNGAGAIMLLSHQPVRSSNGGPNTIVYPFDLYMEEGGDYQFDIIDAPPSWNVLVAPSSGKTMPGETVKGWVIVEAEGGHAHGGSDEFKLQVNDAAATLDLALHYPEVAVPSGHHNQLYLHGRIRDTPFDYQRVSDSAITADRVAWMNTHLEDPAAEGTPIPFEFRHGGWLFPLSPGLGTGLEFLDGVATVQVRMETTRGIGTAGDTFWAELRLGETSDPVSETQPVQVDIPGGGTDLTFALPISAQTVPATPDLGLFLQIFRQRDAMAVPGDLQGFDVPQVVPGGTIMLPLGEYRDEIPAEALAALAASGALDADGRLEPMDAVDPQKTTPAMGTPALLAGICALAAGKSRGFRKGL